MAMDGVSDPGEEALRASDAEREAVVQRLTAAFGEGRISAAELHERTDAAHAAVTRVELSTLTRDLLPRDLLNADLSGAERAAPPSADGWPATAAPVVAVFGGTERRGRWRPARRQMAVALFGGVVLDLREAELPPGVLQLHAYALFGGIKIILSEGMRVEMTGFSLFGGRSVKRSGAPSATQTPVLRLHAYALFGGVAAEPETAARY